MTEDTFESLLAEALALAEEGWTKAFGYSSGNWRERRAKLEAVADLKRRAWEVPT